jgi:hypothetical protein
MVAGKFEGSSTILRIPGTHLEELNFKISILASLWGFGLVGMTSHSH